MRTTPADDAVEMDESNLSHSFVVKVWCEEIGETRDHYLIRGRVTHAQGGESFYFQDLSRVAEFIQTFVACAEPSRNGLARIRGWLKKARSHESG